MSDAPAIHPQQGHRDALSEATRADAIKNRKTFDGA